MAEEFLLSDDFLRQLINVGEVDILVGIATHNHAKTIGQTVRSIQIDLLNCFPRERAVIINADGGSQDGTPELVTGAAIDDMRRASSVYALRTLHSISTQYARAPEPGLALRTILAAADLLRPRACIVVSPDPINREQDWLQRLIRPVYRDNFDFVSPIYRRHKFEAIVTRNLLYPTTRAIYGQRVREPYASEFAVSNRLANDFLNSETGNEEWYRIGGEIDLTITALSGDYRICQAFLGTKEQRDGASADLVTALRRTVGPLFSSLDRQFPHWSVINGSLEVPTVGPAFDLLLEPIRTNRKRLREMFVTGIAQLDSVFRTILSASTLSRLKEVATLEADEFEYPADLWARTVFEFAASYHKAVINRDHILQALVPLYRGRALAFVLQNRSDTAEDIETQTESLCSEFERLKPYLLEMWAEKK